MTDPAGLRASYRRGHLAESEVAATWFAQLREWFDQAVADPAVPEANAVALATCSADGTPSVRTVLVKGLDERGIVFYTNHQSAKAVDLAANPRAAAAFAWLPHERQVRLSGPVEQVSRAETEAYFAQRPRESQLGAWASPQSHVVTSRAQLEAMMADVEARFAHVETIPAPLHWGGYRLAPTAVEFWQGRVGRMHDRIRFRCEAGSWLRERLAP